MSLHGRFCAVMTILMIIVAAPVFACGSNVRPLVDIQVSETPVLFNVSQSTAQLNTVNIDTKSPFPARYHTDVGGVMSAQLHLDHVVKFLQEKEQDRLCVRIEKVTVTLELSPTIFIASDFQDQPCWFKQVFRHEAKHLAVDREIAAKYAGQVKDAMNMMLMMPADYNSGWIARDLAGQVQEDMHESIEKALAVMFDKMTAERLARQQSVDSTQEYQRINKACHSPAS